MKSLLIILCLLGFVEAQDIVSEGEVLVNGKILKDGDIIKQGDTIETKSKSRVRFNIGKDAFSANTNSKFKLEKDGDKRVLNVISGRVMSVFGGGKHAVKSINMTAGIRGTGTYTFVEDGKTYFCTCYGETDVTDSVGGSINLKATHHNMVWITKDGIKPVHDMQSHGDDELRFLEKMVGRIPPFDVKK